MRATRARCLPCLLLAAALICVIRPPAPARAAGYGIASASEYAPNAQFAYCAVAATPCPPGALHGYYARADFTRLRDTLPVSYSRFILPYNALYDYNPRTRQCRFSPAYRAGPGRAAWAQLVYEIQASLAAHLQPVVGFTNGIGGYGDPELPDPSYGATGKPFAGWTTAGYDYVCAVYGVMHWLTGNRSGLGDNPVRRWEPWNEPDGAAEFNGARAGACARNPDPCGGTRDPYTKATYNANGYLCGAAKIPFRATTARDCGPMEAAELWVLAKAEVQQTFAPYGFKLAAADTSHAEDAPYEQHYIAQLHQILWCHAGYYPSCKIGIQAPHVWATHDYDDPSSGRLNVGADISSYTETLRSWWGAGQEVWITEGGVGLVNTVTRDLNGTSACGRRSFAACLDGNPAMQANGARTWMHLGSFGHGETITQIDWYEYQPNNRSSGWDSGMVSPGIDGDGDGDAGRDRDHDGDPSFASPDGAYAVPRASFCVLAHVAPSQCSTRAVDHTTWSSLPYLRQSRHGQP